MEQITSEQIWNSVFGPYHTQSSVLLEAEFLKVTPQEFTQSCIVKALDVGADFGQGDRVSDQDYAFCDLCRQLDITTVA